MLTEIALPPAGGLRSTYLKLRRRGSFDFPMLGVAAALRMDGDVVREARIVLGAVASLAARGRRSGRAACRPAPHRGADRARPPASRPGRRSRSTIPTSRIPYRKKMTRVFVTRALRHLAGLPQRTDDGGAADA